MIHFDWKTVKHEHVPSHTLKHRLIGLVKRLFEEL